MRKMITERLARSIERCVRKAVSESVSDANAHRARGHRRHVNESATYSDSLVDAIMKSCRCTRESAEEYLESAVRAIHEYMHQGINCARQTGYGDTYFGEELTNLGLDRDYEMDFAELCVSTYPEYEAGMPSRPNPNDLKREIEAMLEHEADADGIFDWEVFNDRGDLMVSKKFTRFDIDADVIAEVKKIDFNVTEICDKYGLDTTLDMDKAISGNYYANIFID